MNGVQVAFAWLGPLRVSPAYSSLRWIATIETPQKTPFGGDAIPEHFKVSF